MCAPRTTDAETRAWRRCCRRRAGRRWRGRVPQRRGCRRSSSRGLVGDSSQIRSALSRFATTSGLVRSTNSNFRPCLENTLSKRRKVPPYTSSPQITRAPAGKVCITDFGAAKPEANAMALWPPSRAAMQRSRASRVGFCVPRVFVACVFGRPGLRVGGGLEHGLHHSTGDGFRDRGRHGWPPWGGAWVVGLAHADLPPVRRAMWSSRSMRERMLVSVPSSNTRATFTLRSRSVTSDTSVSGSTTQ